LVGKPEGKKPLGRDNHMWGENIKLSLQEMGWGKDCVVVDQYRDM
jgi:hypothetical protein